MAAGGEPKVQFSKCPFKSVTDVKCNSHRIEWKQLFSGIESITLVHTAHSLHNHEAN